MRKLCFLLCFLLLLLCGCSKQPTPATDVLADLLSLPAINPPTADIYFAQGAPEARLEVVLQDLYGAETDMLTRLADYAIFLGRNTTLYEIHILRAVSASDIPALRCALTTRAKLLCLATEEGHTTPPSAIVYEVGDLLFLFATPHNDILQAAVL